MNHIAECPLTPRRSIFVGGARRMDTGNERKDDWPAVAAGNNLRGNIWERVRFGDNRYARTYTTRIFSGNCYLAGR